MLTRHGTGLDLAAAAQAASSRHALLTRHGIGLDLAAAAQAVSGPAYHGPVSQPVPDLAARYGGPNPLLRRLVVALVVVLAAAGLSWTVWAAVGHSHPTVQSQLVAFDVRGQHTASARFTVVRRSAGLTAHCLLRAVAADHSVVGELQVTVGPGRALTSTVRRSVRTDRAATSVELVGCRTSGQPRLG